MDILSNISPGWYPRLSNFPLGYLAGILVCLISLMPGSYPGQCNSPGYLAGILVCIISLLDT
jgi:hypothetical protein